MDSWPKGFRFHPTDEEIVDHYLEAKKRDNSFFVEGYIPEINMNEFEPWEIFGTLSTGLADEECHFFTPRKLKHPKSKKVMVDRTTKTGYWKVQGSKRKVASKGYKQGLTFYTGRPKNEERTGWIMHEYEHKDLKNYVLCRLKENENDTDQQGSSSAPAGLVPEQVRHQQNMVDMSNLSNNDFHNLEQNMGVWNYNSYGHNSYTFDDTDNVTKFYD